MTRLVHSRLLFVALVLVLCAPAATAQDNPVDTSAVEDDAEAALDDLEVGDGSEELAELLLDLVENPLDLNAATADELALIPAITPLIAQRIVAFREQFGPYGSVAEMRSVEGVTDYILTNARPFLRVEEPSVETAGRPARYPEAPSFGEITRQLRFDLIQRYTRRLDLGRGYDDDTTRTTYAGSPERLYTRLRARYRRQVSLNLTLDKDPGELFSWDPASQTYGYDHLSAHAALRDFGRIKALIVGDFTAEFGQGVAFWRSYSFGKGRDPVRPIVRSGRGLVPYGSTEENRFLRGAAGTFLLTPDLAASAFVSRRTLDATLFRPDTTLVGFDSGVQATTLSTSGLHRTPSEIDRKDALGETLYGSALEYSFGQAQLGIVGYHSRFDVPIQPDMSRLYQRYRFSGDAATMVSVYGNASVRSLLFFGEGARAPGGAFGGLGGVVADFGPSAEALLLARYFPRDFASLHGYAFGERNGATENEAGVYLGLRLRPTRAWTVKAYFDQYRFPWVRFAVPRPSSGYDGRLVVEHRPRPWLSYYVQLRSETREDGTALEAGGPVLDALAEETRQSARLHLDYRFSPDLRLRSRVEVTRYTTEDDRADDPTEHGLILYQDVRWLLTRRLRLDARLAFFDTDSFNARVYAYENDLLYTFAVPAFFGKGQRAYVLATFSPLDRLSVQFKYGITRFEDVDTVGSGLDEVEGNQLRELRAQLRWKF